VNEDVVVILQEIRDNQREAIALQREHMALAARQFERAERLQDRAEILQSRVGGVQKFAAYVLLPVIVIALALLVWPYLRYLWWMISQ
jgi:hypothetical protein